MNNAILFLLGMLLSTSVFAWTAPADVTKIWNLNGSIRVDTTSTSSSDSGGCTPGAFYWSSVTNPHSDDLLSMALSAQMSGKKISVVMMPGQPCDAGVGGATPIYQMAIE